MSEDERMLDAVAFALLLIMMVWWLRGAPETLLVTVRLLATGGVVGSLVYWLLGRLSVGKIHQRAA